VLLFFFPSFPPQNFPSSNNPFLFFFVWFTGTSDKREGIPKRSTSYERGASHGQQTKQAENPLLFTLLGLVISWVALFGFGFLLQYLHKKRENKACGSGVGDLMKEKKGKGGRGTSQGPVQTDRAGLDSFGLYKL